MEISTLEWAVTIVVTVGVLLFDIIVIARDPHEPTMRECAVALGVYIGAAIAFGAWIWAGHGHDYGVGVLRRLADGVLALDRQPVRLHHLDGRAQGAAGVPAGSTDGRHRAGADLPRHLHRAGLPADRELQLGVLRFGAFLVYTAVTLVGATAATRTNTPRTTGSSSSPRSHLNVGEEYHGLKLWYRENGTRVVSPMLIVIIALGTTDLLFALDSIPAIFGITQEPYLVFTANVFALMGLRQLYFLLGGLLKRLVYLSLGLAFILAFIGVKLVLHALHENELPFINGGEPVDVPEISSLLSLGVIIVTLA